MVYYVWQKQTLLKTMGIHLSINKKRQRGVKNIWRHNGQEFSKIMKHNRSKKFPRTPGRIKHIQIQTHTCIYPVCSDCWWVGSDVNLIHWSQSSQAYHLDLTAAFGDCHPDLLTVFREFSFHVFIKVHKS